ncbi:hypothetical protein DMN91_004878 [Ooceraea biroi]|uniref:Cuticle protein n=1 Tax=Ooceraea biroi TaxID=2015173 RepID=A0A3L8DQ90_OOCBI|nr:hypothetical protein DMN91_004878 [Ooceraea biroi]
MPTFSCDQVVFLVVSLGLAVGQHNQPYPVTTPVPILKQINKHNEDGSYSYGYEAADGSYKIESKYPSGEVYGKYGFVDDTGSVREVEYGASRRGFEPVGPGINVPPPTLTGNSIAGASNSGHEPEDDGQYREDPSIYYTDPRFTNGERYDPSPKPYRQHQPIGYNPPQQIAPAYNRPRYNALVNYAQPAPVDPQFQSEYQPQYRTQYRPQYQGRQLPPAVPRGAAYPAEVATVLTALLLAVSAQQPGGNYVDDYAQYDSQRPSQPTPRSYATDDVPARQAAAPANAKPPVAILKQINRHNEDGSYTYGFEGADGSFKIETKLPTGDVRGKYGFVDDTGKVAPSRPALPKPPIFTPAAPAPRQSLLQNPGYEEPAPTSQLYNQGPAQFSPAPNQQERRSQPQPRSGGGILDQLARDYALPQGVAPPLHDISFGYYK